MQNDGLLRMPKPNAGGDAVSLIIMLLHCVG